MDEVFSESERRVFAYFDGAKQVFADPLALHRRYLAAFEGDPNPTHEQMDHAEPGVWTAAVERVVAAVRVAFQMAPWDAATGAGATETDCLAALQAWQAWLAQKKGPAAS